METTNKDQHLSVVYNRMMKFSNGKIKICSLDAAERNKKLRGTNLDSTSQHKDLQVSP